MTEKSNLDLLRQNYMDDSEFDAIHYYFNQVAYPESYKNILETLLSRRISDFNNPDSKRLLNGCRAIATISKFNGIRYLGDRVYAQIGDKIEMICTNDFERPELIKILDGPFNTFQELKLAYNEFLEKLEIDNVIEFFKSTCDDLSVPKIEIDNKEIEVESGKLIYASLNGFDRYCVYRLDEDLTSSHLNKYQSEIAKILDISKDRIYEYIDTKTIYYIEHLRGGIYEYERVGVRYFANVADIWMMIYNNKFGEPEFSQCILGPFNSQKSLCLELESFMNSVGEDDFDYEDEDGFDYQPVCGGDNSPYEDTYASRIEGLSDEFIDDALGGEPDAYWNID